MGLTEISDNEFLIENSKKSLSEISYQIKRDDLLIVVTMKKVAAVVSRP